MHPNSQHGGKQAQNQHSAGLQPLHLHPQDSPSRCQGRTAGSEQDTHATAPQHLAVCPAASNCLVFLIPSLHLAILARRGRKED
jgi:hypothetical protein